METIILLLSVALAQASAPPTLSPEQLTVDVPTSDARRRTGEDMLGGPPDRVVDLIGKGKIALEVSEKKSELSLGYGGSRMRRASEGAVTRINRRSWQVGLELPIGGGDNLLSQSTIDALEDGPAVSGTVNWFATRSEDRLDQPPFQEIMSLAIQKCKDDPAHKMTTEACERERRQPSTRFAMKYSGLSEGAINRTLLYPGRLGGIEVRAGWNKFEFRLPSTLEENSRVKPQFSLRAYAGYIPSDALRMISGSIEYQNAFEAADETILCKPVVANPSDDCVKASPAAPRNVEKLLLAADYRQVLGEIGAIGELAISPKGTFDALSNEWELDLPLYFKPRNGFGLLPGVRATYNSDKSDVTFSVFLKQSFGF